MYDKTHIYSGVNTNLGHLDLLSPYMGEDNTSADDKTSTYYVLVLW